MTSPLTVRAYRHVIPNGTYPFPELSKGNLLECVYFRNDEDFGPCSRLWADQAELRDLPRDAASAGINGVRHILVSLSFLSTVGGGGQWSLSPSADNVAAAAYTCFDASSPPTWQVLRVSCMPQL
jgi:hypothetical protein